MLVEMRFHSNSEGRGVIQLTVPPEETMKIVEMIRGVLTFAGHKVRRVNDDGEEWVTADEVFPDGSPAMALRGFRGKMEWTQQELAEKLGITQNSVSEMESGKRPISKSMVARLGKIFDISHKAFL